MPKAMIGGSVYMYILYLVVPIALISLPPGTAALAIAAHPFADAFQALFPTISRFTALGVTSIQAFATVLPWLFAFNRQVFSLSRKGFIPQVFSRISSTGVPYTALLFCCLFGYAIVLMLIQANNPQLVTIILNISIMSTLLLYIAINVIFIKLRFSMSDHERKFKSVFGLWGPAYSIAVYVVSFIFLIWGVYDTIGISIAVFVAVIFLWMLYFYFVSRKNIVLDNDEKNAIVVSMDLESVLRTEHGFSYMEKHCKKEMNAESLYCLRELREILGSEHGEISIGLIKEFGAKYVRYLYLSE